MSLALVESYSVEVLRQPTTQARLHLRTRAVGRGATAERRVMDVLIDFRETYDRHGDGGGPTPRAPEILELEGRVRVVLPYRDFERMYHVLQTESPVYARWDAGDHADSAAHEAAYFAITTFDEPPGEGHEDESAS